MFESLREQYALLDAPGRASLVLLAIMICALVVSMGAGWKRYKGESMLTKEEKQEVSDGLTDMLLELHAQGKLSTYKVNKLHVNFAKQHGLWDLCPRKLIQETPNPVDLKEDINNRMGESLLKTDPWIVAVENCRK